MKLIECKNVSLGYDGKEILNYKVYVRESGAQSASVYDVTSNRWDIPSYHLPFSHILFNHIIQKLKCKLIFLSKTLKFLQNVL